MFDVTIAILYIISIFFSLLPGFEPLRPETENERTGKARKILLSFFFNFLKFKHIYIFYIYFLNFDTWSLVMASCISNYPIGLGHIFYFPGPAFSCYFMKCSIFSMGYGLWATANEKKSLTNQSKKNFN